MAAAKDALFSETSGDSGPNFTWTGRNIAADRLVVAIYMVNGAVAAAISSFTSPNLTWTNRVAAVDAGGNYRVEIWTAYAASALTAEVITQQCSGGSHNQRAFVLVTVSGTDASGPGNTATDIDNAPGDPTLTVTATAAGSYILAGLRALGGGGDQTEDGNTTQEFSTGSLGGFTHGARVWSRSTSGSGAHTVASTGDDVLVWVMGGLEVKAAGAAGGGTPSVETWQPRLTDRAKPKPVMIPSGMKPPNAA